jgi:hypothetical protein
MSHIAPSIFDAFNARVLNPADVAKTFVPSDQYTRLVKQRHSILLGPRGSGKTTLLKMLQQPALEFWSNSLGDSCRHGIDFTGVFIATDINWSEQIRALGHGELDQESHKLLAIATFTTHVLRAAIVAMMDRIETSHVPFPHRRVHLPIEKEETIAVGICKSWHLKDTIPSLLGVKQSLTQRLLSIRELASREVTKGINGRADRLADERFLHLHFLQSCAVAVELFDDTIEEKGKRWALMFDELELAPEWIQDQLSASLRSTDDRFLFKLALNPYSPNSYLMKSVLAPSPRQDFDLIGLWYAEKRESYEFCNKLWETMLKSKGIPFSAAKTVLGTSYFETPLEEYKDQGTAYRPGTKVARRFQKLAQQDSTFLEYLRENDLDIQAFGQLSADQRAAELRKIAPIVAVREFYRRRDLEDSEVPVKTSRRSRKSALLYAGADSIFAITEGNPRWFIGIIDRLLDRWNPKDNRIDQLFQADEITRAAQQFAAMLRTIPIPRGSGIRSPQGVLSLVKLVAKYFHAQVVDAPFRAEPPGTFIVDAQSALVSDDLLDSIGKAVNAGAFVYVRDDEGQLLLNSVRGKRFRISYLVAPIYKFPIRLGKEVALSTVLRWNVANSQPEQENLPLKQGESRRDV